MAGPDVHTHCRLALLLLLRAPFGSDNHNLCN